MIINIGDGVHYTIVGAAMYRVATPENIEILQSLADAGDVFAVEVSPRN